MQSTLALFVHNPAVLTLFIPLVLLVPAGAIVWMFGRRRPVTMVAIALATLAMPVLSACNPVVAPLPSAAVATENPAAVAAAPTPTAVAAPGSGTTKPPYVTALEAAYGAPSQAGFGSAVFYAKEQPAGDLEQAALALYRYFVGDLWARYGEDAWMGSWRKVYARPDGVAGDIVAELRAINDRDAAGAVEIILDNIDDAGRAQVALAQAFDDPGTSELAVFTIGDGAAMSGIIVAGRRATTGESVFLVFLMD